MKKINIAIVGVGNFAKALIEGIAYYTHHPHETIGLMHPILGGYLVSDIRPVAAFDIDERKVGKLLHEAIHAEPNVTTSISSPLMYDAIVHRGPTLDGAIHETRDYFIHESSVPVTDIVSILKETCADIVVNLLPTGAEQATTTYARAALEARCSFVNCIPSPLASDPQWSERFRELGRVLFGDDIKSQLGATFVNRGLLSLLHMRGVHITRSQQENRGGNADHFNLLYRSSSKEKSKRNALAHVIQTEQFRPEVTFSYTGIPSGHKQVTITIHGELFGRVPITLTTKIEDEISINGAGVVVDAIRAAQFLVDTKKQIKSDMLCPFLMKSPLHPLPDQEAYELFERVIHDKDLP